MLAFITYSSSATKLDHTYSSKLVAIDGSTNDTRV